MENKIQIIIGSPIEYKELVAYIVIDGEHIALLNQDEGKDKIKVEFFIEPEFNKVYLDTLLEALLKAKLELIR